MAQIFDKKGIVAQNIFIPFMAKEGDIFAVNGELKIVTRHANVVTTNKSILETYVSENDKLMQLNKSINDVRNLLQILSKGEIR